MNLKELIKEVEKIQRILKEKGFLTGYSRDRAFSRLMGITHTVEAVRPLLDIFFEVNVSDPEFIEDKKDWQKLKKLLGIK